MHEQCLGNIKEARGKILKKKNRKRKERDKREIKRERLDDNLKIHTIYNHTVGYEREGVMHILHKFEFYLDVRGSLNKKT